MKRRSLLGAAMAAFAAPAYVKAGILMPVKRVYVPEMIGPRGYLFDQGMPSGYVVFVHPDEGRWWKDQIGFIPAERYAGMVPLRGEIGSLNGGIRFIESRGPA